MAGGWILGALRVTLGLDTADFESGGESAERQIARMEREFKAFGNRMVGLGAKLSIAITSPLILFGKSAFKAASDAAELDSAFAQTFGNMTKELRKSEGGPFKTISVPPREGITTGFAISPDAALVAATGRDWSFVHRGPGEKWDTPLTLGGPPFEDLAFSDARHATLVRGGPGQEFAEVYRTDDAGLNWKLVKI